MAISGWTSDSVERIIDSWDDVPDPVLDENCLDITEQNGRVRVKFAMPTFSEALVQHRAVSRGSVRVLGYKRIEVDRTHPRWPQSHGGSLFDNYACQGITVDYAKKDGVYTPTPPGFSLDLGSSKEINHVELEVYFFGCRVGYYTSELPEEWRKKTT